MVLLEGSSFWQKDDRLVRFSSLNVRPIEREAFYSTNRLLRMDNSYMPIKGLEDFVRHT